MKKLAIVLSLMFISIGVFGQAVITGLEDVDHVVYSTVEGSSNTETKIIYFKDPQSFTIKNNQAASVIYKYVNSSYAMLEGEFGHMSSVPEAFTDVLILEITYRNIEFSNIVASEHPKYTEGVNSVSVSCDFVEQDTIDAYNNGFTAGVASVDTTCDCDNSGETKVEYFKSNSVDYDITVSNGYLRVESFDFVNKITIYDVNGRVVKVENMFSVWVEDLAKGVYIAVVEFDDKSVSYKFSR